MSWTRCLFSLVPHWGPSVIPNKNPQVLFHSIAVEHCTCWLWFLNISGIAMLPAWCLVDAEEMLVLFVMSPSSCFKKYQVIWKCVAVIELGSLSLPSHLSASHSVPTPTPGAGASRQLQTNIWFPQQGLVQALMAHWSGSTSWWLSMWAWSSNFNSATN